MGQQWAATADGYVNLILRREEIQWQLAMLKHLGVFGPLLDYAKIINVLLSWYTQKHGCQYLRDSDCSDYFHLWNPESVCGGSLAHVTRNAFIWNFVGLPWQKSWGAFSLNSGASVPDSRWRTLVWFCVVSLKGGCVTEQRAVVHLPEVISRSTVPEGRKIWDLSSFVAWSHHCCILPHPRNCTFQNKEVSYPMMVSTISKCCIGFESQGDWFFVAIYKV